MSIFPDPTTDRDFPEDFEKENGCYYNKCCLCGEMFKGNKHRVVCKLCSNALPIKTENSMSIIDKLGIKPIESHAVRNGFACDTALVRILEQQNMEMVEAMVRDVDLLGNILEDGYGDVYIKPYIESEILNRIDIIQRISPNKSLTDIEIKELI